jgi:RNAse (barnase) inhibitor barstar
VIFDRTSKRVYEIDGARFSTLEGFFDEISRVLVPRVPWGRNLDAFNDILRGGFGTPEDGFVLLWIRSDVSRERLGYPETVRQLEMQLQRCHPSHRTSIVGRIEAAKRGEGPTVFDWLIDIISNHTAGGREEEDGVELMLV